MAKILVWKTTIFLKLIKGEPDIFEICGYIFLTRAS
jgi:hypothetical protein